MYYLSHKYNWEGGKFLTVVLIVLGYIFVFPKWFYPKFEEGEIVCGLPILGVVLGVWYIGLIGLICTHIFYAFVLRRIWRK